MSDQTCQFSLARWQLSGPAPLPALSRAISIGTLARKAVMSQCRQIFGASSLPPVLSGHGLPSGQPHRHIFFLPEDADCDGLIDHVNVYLPARFDNATLRALVNLEGLWDGPRGEWRVAQVWVARPGEALGSLVAKSRVFTSATPFLAPRHIKRNFGVPDQIRWQCREMGWPEPQNIDSVNALAGSGTRLHPSDFDWHRPGSFNAPPDKRGSFWRLTFGTPQTGPLALGHGCHFGLGLFRPVPEGEE